MMNGRIVRWGILGTAQIARKNWRAIQQAGNATVVALASRDLNRAQDFINACQAEAPMEIRPRAFGSYEDVLALAEVDAVYIPLPTGIRKEWVVRAAKAGKHILCEKPCAISYSDLVEMIEVCRENKVLFLDGVMFMHSARLDRMRSLLDDQAQFGRIKRITSAFSFCGDDGFFDSNIRSLSSLEPHGCLGDLGWYCIRLAIWAMHGRMPEKVRGRVLRDFRSNPDDAAVPVEFAGELFFDQEVSSSFYCSFLTHDEQWAWISGTKGNLQLSDFVVPFDGSEISFRFNQTEFQTDGCEFRMKTESKQIQVKEPSHGRPDAQETRMFRHFSEAIGDGGQIKQEWTDWALKTQMIMNTLQDSAEAGGIELPVKWGLI